MGSWQTTERHTNCEVWVWQHHVGGFFASAGTGALYKIDVIMMKEKKCGHGEVTSQDLSQEVKAWAWMDPPDRLFAKWLQDHKLKVLERLDLRKNVCKQEEPQAQFH